MKTMFGEARQPLQKHIAGVQFTINPMKGRDANRAAFRFARAFGPVMAVLAGGALAEAKSGRVGSSKGPLDIDIDLERGVAQLFGTLTEQQYEEICDELLASASIMGTQGSVDHPAFIGKPELILLFCKEIALYQFAGFFSDWLPKIQANFGKIMAQTSHHSQTVSPDSNT